MKADGLHTVAQNGNCVEDIQGSRLPISCRWPGFNSSTFMGGFPLVRIPDDLTLVWPRYAQSLRGKQNPIPASPTASTGYYEPNSTGAEVWWHLIGIWIGSEQNLPGRDCHDLEVQTY